MKISGISYPWKRALGITKVKQRLAHAIGIPLSMQGVERKIGSTILKCAKKMMK